MAKETVTQRSFLRGQTRAGLLGGNDLEIYATSIRTGENVRVEATRALTTRMGSTYITDKETALDIVELRPETGQIFALVYGASFLWVLNEDGTEAFATAEEDVPWFASLGSGAATGDIWVEPFRERTFIGGEWGLWELVYDDGSWTFQEFTFDDAPGGELAQPYWAFVKNLSFQPSALTGSITLESSIPYFTADYVGLRVRYNNREILITAFTDSTTVTGTVVNDLAPSFRVTLDSTTGFRVGDPVIGEDTNYQGIIVSVVSSTQIDVVTLEFFEGPDVGERLNSPVNGSEVTAKTTVSPLFSPVADEQLMSPVRGYPKAGAGAAGRLCLIDFPQVPDLIVVSSSRSVSDLKVGAEDDDAIARQVGDNSPRFLHAINAGDLLLLSDRGLYYVGLREGNPLTPASFNPILIDKRGASPVRPAQLDDAVVFVEASGESVAAAQLDGNIYLKWSVRTISTLHSDIIRSPIKLCGPSLFSGNPEKYLFVINEEGTLAAMSWFTDFAPDSVGFTLWITRGDYLSVSPVFGTYWAICERNFRNADGTARLLRTIESMSQDARLDCEVPLADSILFRGRDIISYSGDWDNGTFTPALADGAITGSGSFPDGSVVGYGFTSKILFWPVREVNTPRGLLKARTIRVGLSVYETGAFQLRCNLTTKTFGGYYDTGDDTADPPPNRTRTYKASVVGVRDFPEIEIIHDRPTKFTLLSYTCEVQI